MNRFRTIATLSALLLVGLASASASLLLPPGGSAAPDILSPSTASTQLMSEAGTAIAQTFTDGYIATVMSDPNNVFCAGCLDFTYTFSDNGPSVNERFTASNFAGFSVDAGYVGTKGLNVNPQTINRSGDGSVVGFNYFPGTGTNLMSGQTTSILIIETNALYFTTGTFTIQDGSTATIQGYAPSLTAITPEPASLALFGSGLLGAVALIRRKRAV
jgi:hypothetical protein